MGLESTLPFALGTVFAEETAVHGSPVLARQSGE